MKIGETEITNNSQTYFIAEIGSNFDGSLKRAIKLIDLAKECGADAVKFQHYTAASLVSDTGFQQLKNKLSHQKDWDGSVFEVYDKASLNREWTQELKDHAKSRDLGFLTSPYSKDLIDFTSDLLDAIKIGSGDITWTQIIEYAAKTGKPILLGTGASNIHEVDLAVKSIVKYNSDFCIMQCNTNYEGRKEDFKYQNLRVLNEYSSRYPQAVLGLSCHMPGHLSVLASVALGARIIEKHFTDDNSRPGPDHQFAMNPFSWEKMVSETRDLETLLGSETKKIEKNEIDTCVVQRRALRVKYDLNQGHVLEESDLTALRPCPADAMQPSEIKEVLGKEIIFDKKEGEAILKSDINY